MLTQLTTVYSQKTVRFADSIRNYYHIPELSYAVIDHAKTIEIAALGHHSIALPDTATLQDRSHIGSNTKAMTAFIIAKYVELGKLKWTTKFYGIYPEWKRAGKEVYKDINLQDLLSHRAGIQPFQGENDPEIP
ncbi:MAG: serine hydrolase, partial [Sediminibacterium sp.]